MEYVDIHGMRCGNCSSYVHVGYGSDNGLWVFCPKCQMAWTFEEVIVRTALEGPVWDGPKSEPSSN